ncbi:MAG TPA: hypothetical protein PLR48_06235 [Bacillota bacterium]|nr:hypothetical protein [Bacillota bacterium]
MSDNQSGKTNDADSRLPDSQSTSSSSSAGNATEVDNGEKKPPLATTRQKIALVLFLLFSTLIFLGCWFFLFHHLDMMLQADYQAKWNMPDNVALQSGPVSFWYDLNKGVLLHRGPIDTKRKQELLGLVKAKSSDTDISTVNMRGYQEAIDELAYKSNDPANSTFILLLLLGGLSGLLGVQLRSMSNFIGVACYKNDLRLGHWWPWYVVRPLEGFLVGTLTIVLAQARLLLPGEQSSIGTVWWLGITVIAGYGTTEFTERLRLVTQTLFGTSKPTQRT